MKLFSSNTIKNYLNNTHKTLEKELAVFYEELGRFTEKFSLSWTTLKEKVLWELIVFLEKKYIKENMYNQNYKKKRSLLTSK